MVKRRKTQKIKFGNLYIGGNAPVSVQSMTKTVTKDILRTVKQIKELENAGCEIIRVAVKDTDDAGAIKAIRKKIGIPLEADIHFHHKLALQSIKNGADLIRINPGNIKSPAEVKEIIKTAKAYRVPIRIGANAGSLDRNRYKGDLAEALVKSVLDYIKIFKQQGFNDIIISLKASGVYDTVMAYRKISGLCDFPLHLGVTATGSGQKGVVKSAIGIGALLIDGIGDTIRVSLTADPKQEIVAARQILEATGRRRFGPDIISCPTCGRCSVDLLKIVNKVKNRLSTIDHRPLTTIAIMGCEVNGPGEAKDADIGIACGRKSAVLFKKGKMVCKVPESKIVETLIKEVF